jgi:hypothetical protein
MTQALYAHMNNKKIKIKKDIAHTICIISDYVTGLCIYYCIILVDCTPTYKKKFTV